MKPRLKWTLIPIGVIMFLVMTALEVPVKLWRTGSRASPGFQGLGRAERAVFDSGSRVR